MLNSTLKIFPLFILLVACSSAPRPTIVVDTGTLAGLKALANSGPGIPGSGTGMNRIREAAIKETALSVGAQSGLAARAKLIDNELTKQARLLDTIYNFNALILEHNILPPVLLEGRNTFNLADAQNIRISDRTYKIAKQARFITTAPTWREYLWMDYQRPECPHISMLPKNKAEKALWCEYVERGWKNGFEQANIILEESIARIKEDFAGMILYRKLHAMNMVSAPWVANTELGVTGDGTEIHIDDRVLRITALPALNTNSDEWRAAVVKDNDALEKFRQMEKLAQETKITISSKAWQPIIVPINEKDFERRR